MQITYTAQELYEHMQSFDTVRFISCQDEETVSAVILDTSAFKLIDRRGIFSIVAEVWLKPSSKVQRAICGICGNEFLCDVVTWKCGSLCEAITIKYGDEKHKIELILE